MILKKYLPMEIISSCRLFEQNYNCIVNEIRLRSEKPLSVVSKGESYLIDKFGIKIYNQQENIISKTDIAKIFEKMCEYSVHKVINQIKDGFITIDGGNRVGIGGIYNENTEIGFNINNITSLNIRIAKEYTGISLPLCQKLFTENIKGTLIVGVPSSGKTTLIRDIALQMSKCRNPNNKKVVIVDSRGEITGMSVANNGFTMGEYTDVILNCEKAKGILNAIRVLSPDVIICDELGNVDEVMAITEALNSGVPIITTAHAANINDIKNKKQIKMLLNTGAFENIVLLKGNKNPTEISSIGEVKFCDEAIGCNNDSSMYTINWNEKSLFL